MTEERAPYGEVQMIAQAEKPCCWNCRHWWCQFTIDDDTFGTCQNKALLENIMVGNGDIDAAKEWTILADEQEKIIDAPVWVEFFPRSTFYCNLHEPKEEE